MSARRGLVSVGGAVLAFVVLGSAGSSLPPPPLGGLPELEVWWTAHGTAVAAFAIIRIVGLALSGYAALLGLTATIAALTRWSWAESVASTCATPLARRLLMGGGLAAGLSLSSVGAASGPAVFDVTDIGTARPVFEIEDLGPVPGGSTPPRIGPDGPVSESPTTDSTTPEPRELVNDEPGGPTAAGPPQSVNDEPGEAIWVVARGDHLWSIAAETVSDRDADSRESTIAAYWLTLIEHNRDVVGDNPDLIHPGDIIRLPG